MKQPEIKETTTFTKSKDGYLCVTHIREMDLMMPQGDDFKKVGFDIQTTMQTIEDYKLYLDYMETQLKKDETDLEKNERLLESVQDINHEIIEPELLVALRKTIDKGSKTFKTQTVKLAQYITKLDRKATALKNKEFITPRRDSLKEKIAEIKELMG